MRHIGWTLILLIAACGKDAEPTQQDEQQATKPDPEAERKAAEAKR